MEVVQGFQKRPAVFVPQTSSSAEGFLLMNKRIRSVCRGSGPPLSPPLAAAAYSLCAGVLVRRCRRRSPHRVDPKQKIRRTRLAWISGLLVAAAAV